MLQKRKETKYKPHFPDVKAHLVKSRPHNIYNNLVKYTHISGKAQTLSVIDASLQRRDSMRGLRTS